MKRFLAIYIGTEDARRKARWDKLGEEERQARQTSGIEAWMSGGVELGGKSAR